MNRKIRDNWGNDLPSLIESLPRLAVIAFNGGTAARIGLKALAQHGDHHTIIKLPSSSPAHTLSYPEKLRAWQALRGWLTEAG